MQEPLYCVVCGKEECDHPYDVEGPYCDVCGVIPRPGGECKYMKIGGREDGCEPQ